MLMKIFIERQNKQRTLFVNKKISVSAVLAKLKINPEEVLVVRDDVVLTDDILVLPTDALKLLSVISGG